jgi:hypothetical protein
VSRYRDGRVEWSARAMTTATSRCREVVASPGAHRTGSEGGNGFASPSPRIENLSPRLFAVAQNMVHGMRGGVRELASRVKRKRLPHGHSLWVAARLLEPAKCTAAWHAFLGIVVMSYAPWDALPAFKPGRPVHLAHAAVVPRPCRNANNGRADSLRSLERPGIAQDTSRCRTMGRGCALPPRHARGS